MSGRLVLSYRLGDGESVAEVGVALPFDPARHDSTATVVTELFESAAQDLGFQLLRTLTRE